MKKLLLFVFVASAMISCKEEAGNGLLDSNAMISIRAAKGKTTTEVRAEAATRAEEHLSALEIVKQATHLVFINEIVYPGNDEISRGFADFMRDIPNERFLIMGDDVIRGPGQQEGELADNIIGAQNLVVVRICPPDEIYDYDHRDTIAYIPNAKLRQAYYAVREAYDKKDYATVYKLFDQAFTYTPITGKEWRELKKQGLN